MKDNDTELAALLVTPVGRSDVDTAYAEWSAERTPDRMKAVLDALDTTINSEVQRFSGPKPLLRSRARSLAVGAIRSYDPASGAKLRSWVVTQLQPLSRYTNALKPVYTPEDAARKAYAVSAARGRFVDETGRDPTDEELADAVGISVKRLKSIRKAAPAVVYERQSGGEDDETAPDYAIYGSSPVRDASEAVYSGLSERDRRIFDLRTGSHGAKQSSGGEVARLLKVSPAYVSQRTGSIADLIVSRAGRM